MRSTSARSEPAVTPAFSSVPIASSRSALTSIPIPSLELTSLRSASPIPLFVAA